MDNKCREEVRVGIADAAIVEAPTNIITIGLGSCVGILIYDREKKSTALIHIMLPDSTCFKGVTNPYKFANLAIPKIVNTMIANGSKRENLVSKICGGAAMFKFPQSSANSEIGMRNGEAVKVALKKEKISVIAEDLGGDKGRSMFVDSNTGIVKIRVVGNGIKEI